MQEKTRQGKAGPGKSRPHGFTAARTAAPTTDSAKLTALLPLLS
jgi:hypothetical protein